jgi:uncharacterized protein (TIGR01244 family)
MTRLRKLPFAAATALLLAACAGLGGGGSGGGTSRLVEAELGDADRVHALEGVWLASQPSAADFALARHLGVRTVVDLRTADEARGFDEPAAVRGLGLAYVTIPMKGPDDLTDEALDRGRDVLRTAERPILVHCSSANRAGALWLVARTLDGGLSWEDALAEAHAAGLTAPALEERARAYVDRRR